MTMTRLRSHASNALLIESEPKKEICVKQLVLIDVMKKFKADGQLKRKLKIFLGVGLVGLLLVGALIIWAGVATVQHVASLGADVNVQEQVRDLKTEMPTIPALAKVGCWDKVQSILNVEVWFEKPVADNLQSLKDACLGAVTK